ncbi:hypothetical protein SLS58_009208 [Diplodia intermedia]|uniref:Uncharacterized protein n=1 Tax=Diplodia intermedia TaxID=856260 RepID=A0ABR3TDQ3_9PEZI
MPLAHDFIHGHLLLLPIAGRIVPDPGTERERLANQPFRQPPPGLANPGQPFMMPLNPAISNVRQDLNYNHDEMAKFVLDAGSALFTRHVALEQPGTYENFRSWLAHLLRSADIELHSVFLGLSYYEAMTLDNFASNPAAPPPTRTASRITTIDDTRNDFARPSSTNVTTTINGVPIVNGIPIINGVPIPSTIPFPSFPLPGSVRTPMPIPHANPQPAPAPAQPTAAPTAPAADPGTLLTVALMAADKLISDKDGHTTRTWGSYAHRPYRSLEVLERGWLVAINHRGLNARWATAMGRWARRWVLWREDARAAARMEVLEREIEMGEKVREDGERGERMRVLEGEIEELRAREEGRVGEMRAQAEEEDEEGDEGDESDEDDDDEALFD